MFYKLDENLNISLGFMTDFKIYKKVLELSIQEKTNKITIFLVLEL